MAAALRLVARKVCRVRNPPPGFLTRAVEAAGHRQLPTSMSSSHGGSSQLIRRRLISTSSESPNLGDGTKAAAARVEEMKKEMLGLLRQMDRDGKRATEMERENKKLLGSRTTGKKDDPGFLEVVAVLGLGAILGGIMIDVSI